jgi:AraC-like DNA-binding protein
MTSAEVVKITETENRGIHSISISHTAIGFVLVGEKYIYNNDRCSTIQAGNIFILGAGHHYEENAIASNGRFEQIVFYLSSEQLQQAIYSLNINYGLTYTSHHICDMCNTFNFAHEVANDNLRNFFLGINISLKSSGFTHNDIGQRIKINELIFLLLSSNDGCIRRKVLSAADSECEQFIHIIYQNLFSNISIEGLAELTNRSLTSFKKEFRRIFHTPPHRWIIAQRLARAKIMVISTSKTISEVGAECGFSNISHFIKLFKHSFGVTPAAMRYSSLVRASKECYRTL